MKNPIVPALETLRTAVVDAAIEQACDVVERQQKGEDIQLTEPRHIDDDGQEQLFDAAQPEPTVMAKMNSVESAKFISDAKKDAEQLYTAFIEKAVTKIGEVVSAKLEGNHVTGPSSVLTVKKADGTEEQWETRQHVNVSKLGKVFVQWPIRKLKQNN